MNANEDENTQIIKKKYMPQWIKMLLAIPGVVIDGVIVFLVATLTTMSMALTGDDAYKYIDSFYLFWMKFTIGSTASGLVALQSFRNKVFAEHAASKQNEQKQ